RYSSCTVPASAATARRRRPCGLSTAPVSRRGCSTSWTATAVPAWCWSASTAPTCCRCCSAGRGGGSARPACWARPTPPPPLPAPRADLPPRRRVAAPRARAAPRPPYLRDFAGRVLDRLPAGDRLCHGDYHPGNVLLGADRTAVIDWTGAVRGVAEADHARTLL